MPRKKIQDRNIRKLSKIGAKKYASYYVTIPIEAIREYKWKEGQKLIVEQKTIKGKPVIVVKDWE